MKQKIMELICQLRQTQPQSLTKRLIEKAVFGLFLLFLFWLFFVHYNNTNHVSVSRNYISGEIALDSTSGVKISAPWVQVIKFDTRPIRVCVDCSCANINCRLIAFNPKGWKEFIDREGIRYFWFKNRLSFNIGQDREYRGISHVLRGYAYDKEYPFIKQLEEVK